MRSGRWCCTYTRRQGRSRASWRKPVAVGTKSKECTTGMRRTWRRPATLALLLCVSLVGWVGLSTQALAQTATTPAAADLDSGKQLYMARCQHCHGESGDGKGVSASGRYPNPRD